MKQFRYLALLFLGLTLSVQSYAQKTAAPQNWQHLDNEKDGYYGVSTDKAYNELLKGKEGKKVVVAVIDSGSDVTHDDLKGVLWTNKGEIAGNGIDDDNNGYIDDVHGWSFLGYKGVNVLEETLELTRLYASYTKEFEGKDLKKLSRKEKKDYKEYQKIKAAFEEERNSTQEQYDQYKSMIHGVVRNYNLIAAYLDKDDFKYNDLKSITSMDHIIQDGKTNFSMILQGDTTISADLIINNIKNRGEKVDNYFTEKLDYNLNPDWAPRADVGYKDSDLKDFNYGSNVYLAGGAENGHGSHCAGIIAAERNNDIGMDGVAGNVEIMTIRAVPNGDEHDRDIAAAMRYAADNGAQIISMSYGKSYSYDKDAVDAAIKYAIKKGVLFVHAAGNDGKDIDKENNFPNVKNSKSNAKAWIEVGASSWKTGEDLPAVFSNYGKKSVDLFAPGVDIYSTVPMNDYDTYSGTSMATPVVAGVAAVVMSYYPDLSAKQVKKILMKSVTELKDLDVKLPNDRRDGEVKKVKFGTLSVSGGIVNLYNALKLAEKE
ncbi:MAG: S8 family serine peptidase [Flavobacteriales bacterium]|nr:S8 family serine peptidase [Flavobacteriales bacterium]